MLASSSPARPNAVSAQIDPIGMPWQIMREGLAAAPNGGYLRIGRRPAQITKRELVSDSARGQIAESGVG